MAQVDVAYAVYFPFIEPYESLYPSGAKSEEKERPTTKAAPRRDIPAERPAMWSVVEKAMAEGKAALERLQNRRSEREIPPPSKPKAKNMSKDGLGKGPNSSSTKTAGAKHAAKPGRGSDTRHEATLVENSDDNDGDGFFEQE